MARNIRTAAAVVAAVAATTFGAAGTAVATPAGDNPVKDAGHARNVRAHLIADLRKAGIRGRIDVGTPVASLPGAPAGSQRVTSATYTMGKFGDTGEIKALCGSGSYVEYIDQPEEGAVGPIVTVNSDSSFVTNAVGYPYAIAPIDESKDQYQGFVMKLSNLNPVSSESGSFSWNCISVG